MIKFKKEKKLLGTLFKLLAGITITAGLTWVIGTFASYAAARSILAILGFGVAGLGAGGLIAIALKPLIRNRVEKKNQTEAGMKKQEQEYQKLLQQTPERVIENLYVQNKYEKKAVEESINIPSLNNADLKKLREMNPVVKEVPKKVEKKTERSVR